MNEVLNGYFEDANRGLQRPGLGVASRFANAPNVQLPPLSDGGPMNVGKGILQGSTREVYSAGARLGKSSSVASLDLSHEKAAIGVQAERYQQALLENDKFSRKVRQLQEQLAITAAKKEAFKAQATKLEKEFRKGRETSDLLQRDLLDTRREHEHSSKEAREAVDMMNEMRKSHIHEVRLLQRGLAARCGNDQFRNKVNEVADLVDKLGRAVVQRDEAVRDKTKLQAQVKQAYAEAKALQDENKKFKRHLRNLEDKNDQTARKAQMRGRDLGGKQGPPSRVVGRAMPDESDDEFERELVTFESKYKLLDEGAQGMNVLAEVLQKEKDMLENTSGSQAEVIYTLESSVAHWKTLSATKERQLKELGKKYADVQKAQSIQAQQIAAKRKEIEDEVENERARFEKHVSLLQAQCDDATSNATGMQQVADKMTQELARVHETYAKQLRDKEQRKKELLVKPVGGPEDDAADAPSSGEHAQGGPAVPQAVVSEPVISEQVPSEPSAQPLVSEVIEPVISEQVPSELSAQPSVSEIVAPENGSAEPAAIETASPEIASPVVDNAPVLPDVTVPPSALAAATAQDDPVSAETEVTAPAASVPITMADQLAAGTSIAASTEEAVLNTEVSPSPGFAEPPPSPAPPPPAAPLLLRGNLEGSITFMGMQFPTGFEVEVLASEQAHEVKTGQVLNIEVCRLGEEELELRTKDVATGHCHSIALEMDLLEELDEDDPWSDLFGRTGFTSDGVLIVASDVGAPQGSEVTLQPAAIAMLLTIRSFGNRRFHVSGMDLATQRMVSLMVFEDSLTPELVAQIDSSPESLPSLLIGHLVLTDGGADLQLTFGPQA